MNGYIVTFFTQQSRGQGDSTIAEWLVNTARQLGIRGATVQYGQEGFGHDGRYHSESMFDLEDRPIQVVMVLTDEECGRLFEAIKQEGLAVFYTKTATEFGVTSKA